MYFKNSANNKVKMSRNFRCFKIMYHILYFFFSINTILRYVASVFMQYNHTNLKIVTLTNCVRQKYLGIYIFNIICKSIKVCLCYTCVERLRFSFTIPLPRIYLITGYQCGIHLIKHHYCLSLLWIFLSSV